MARPGSNFQTRNQGEIRGIIVESPSSLNSFCNDLMMLATVLKTIVCVYHDWDIMASVKNCRRLLVQDARFSLVRTRLRICPQMVAQEVYCACAVMIITDLPMQRIRCANNMRYMSRGSRVVDIVARYLR